MVIPGTSPPMGLLWPHAGFAFAVTCLGGLGYMPALFLGFLAGLGLPGVSWLLFLGNSIAYCVGALVAWIFFYRIGKFAFSLERMRDVGLFMAGVLVCSFTTSFLIAVFAVWVAPATRPGDFSGIWFPQWAADGMGVLVIAPLFFAWSSKSWINWDNRQFVEVLLWLLILICFGALIFGNWAPTDTLRYPMELALFPIMAWAAVRFGQRGVTTGILIISLMAIWQLLQVFGPEEKYISQSPNFLWAFIGVLSITSLFLAAIITEIRNREQSSLESENRLRAFMQAMPDIAFLIREDGYIPEVFSPNRGIYSTFANRIKDCPIRESLPLKLAEKLLSKVQLCLDTGTVQVLEYALDMEGKTWWFEGRLSGVRNKVLNISKRREQRSVVLVAYEITERKLAEAALKRRDDLLQASANAKNTLLTLTGPEEAVEQVCRVIGEKMDVSRFFLYENFVDPKTGVVRLRCHYEWVPHGMIQMSNPGELLELNYEKHLPGWIERFEKGELIHGVLNEFDPGIREHVRTRRALSLAWMPVRVNHEFWGVLGMEDCESERIWEENELNILRLMAASFGGFFLIKKNESELRDAKVSADEANAAKSEFLAMMSHEIRTPMNSIIGFADLMNQEQMSEEQLEYLNIIRRSGNSLLELINNILDYSKIESRNIELEETQFKLEQIIGEVLEMVMVKAREKSISVDYEVRGQMPEVLIGDPHRIRQIFLNLVNNAVKFTDEGEIWIKVESTIHPRKKWVRLHCQVIDQGIGIPASKLKKLFQPFTQIDSSTTRQFGGTGLGLVISKRLCERMDGKMWVESEVGAGSIFNFTLDLPYEDMKEINEEKPADKEKLSPDFQAKYPLSLLLAEDEPVNRILAQELLKQLGYSLDIAEDGLEALNAIERESYDVVFMDVHMPGLDGLEVTRKIRAGRAGEARKNQYIIAMTAFALDEDRKKCIEAGMNDYLSKPIQIERIKRSLERAYQFRMSS